MHDESNELVGELREEMCFRIWMLRGSRAWGRVIKMDRGTFRHVWITEEPPWFPLGARFGSVSTGVAASGWDRQRGRPHAWSSYLIFAVFPRTWETGKLLSPRAFCPSGEDAARPRHAWVVVGGIVTGRDGENGADMSDAGSHAKPRRIPLGLGWGSLTRR
jgi:hypothetical protein